MTDSLFATSDESRRDELRRRQWVIDTSRGAPLWRAPWGELLTESGAFAWLESHPEDDLP